MDTSNKVNLEQVPLRNSYGNKIELIDGEFSSKELGSYKAYFISGRSI